MKKSVSVMFAILLLIAFQVVSFADNVYIVDDGEDDFVPETTTLTPTTEPSVTTTGGLLDAAANGEGVVDGILDRFSGVLDGDADSLLSRLQGIGGNNETTTASQNVTQNNLPQINVPQNGYVQSGSGSLSPAGTTSAQGGVTASPTTTQNNAANQTEAPADNDDAGEEVASVLVVNSANKSNMKLDGSTLTLVVFIAAVIIIVLTAAIILIFMTRRTEFDSEVKRKSTIPNSPQPGILKEFADDADDFLDDDEKDDYSDISYWNSDDEHKDDYNSNKTARAVSRMENYGDEKSALNDLISDEDDFSDVSYWGDKYLGKE